MVNRTLSRVCDKSAVDSRQTSAALFFLHTKIAMTEEQALEHYNLEIWLGTKLLLSGLDRKLGMDTEKIGVRWYCKSCGAHFWEEQPIEEIRHLHDRERWKAYTRSCTTCQRQKSMRIDVIGKFSLYHKTK